MLFQVAALVAGIQDFPNGGGGREGCATYCLAKFPLKIVWKWKEFDREGRGHAPSFLQWFRLQYVQIQQKGSCKEEKHSNERYMI